jgi:hypothetical protein
MSIYDPLTKIPENVAIDKSRSICLYGQNGHYDHICLNGSNTHIYICRYIGSNSRYIYSINYE